MKSAIVASALFASMALAAPLHKRAYATKTNTVIETVVVFTTVWDSPAPAATQAPTSSPAMFYEQPSSSAAPTTSEAAPSSEPEVPVVPSSTSEVVVPTPTPEAPSSTPEPVYETPTPAPEPSTPAPEPTSSPSPTPSPAPEPTPAPEPSPEPQPTPSPSTPAAPAPTKPSNGGGSGEEYTGSLTMNYYGGGLGACGEAINDDMMVAALAVDGFGASTYDTATGNPTNKWCNQKIRVTYNGQTADATIMDRCAGCTGAGGLDATPALWEALTGGIGGANGDRLESGMTFTLVN